MFSSDDSEDNNIYHPSGADILKKFQEEGSSSAESNFTSDSDNFSAFSLMEMNLQAHTDPLSVHQVVMHLLSVLEKEDQ